MGEVLMKRLSMSVLLLTLIGSIVGCGQQQVSFRKSGDENSKDAIPADPSDPIPCIGSTGCPSNPPTNGADLFFQTPKDGRVDILFIDDNSGSMSPEQNLLGQRFNTFISSLHDLDWQIGITTTDVTNDPVNGLKGSISELFGHPGRYILNKTFPNVDNVFKRTIVRQETLNCENNPASCPSGNEQPLYASMLAMEKRNTNNAGFFRNGSDLAIVVLSDEDEMSTGPASATQPGNVIDKFKSIWGPEKKLSVYGIIIKPGDTACLTAQRAQSNGTGYEGKSVAQLSRMTGGVIGSICDSDYTQTLQEIGNRVHELINAFDLAHIPEPGTVQVRLTPAQNINWRIEGNKLIFASAPAAGTRIDVAYSYR